MSTLKTRVTKLEGKTKPGAVLLVMVGLGETQEQAVERTCRAWNRPPESFALRIVLNYHGAPDA